MIFETNSFIAKDYDVIKTDDITEAVNHFKMCIRDRYEYVNLMALVNPAVGFLSEDAVKFFIMYSIDTYDDRNNSSYTCLLYTSRCV